MAVPSNPRQNQRRLLGKCVLHGLIEVDREHVDDEGRFRCPIVIDFPGACDNGDPCNRILKDVKHAG